MTLSNEDNGDKAPKELYIGAINPFALTEGIIGRKIDWSDPESMRIVSETLETDYSELFDMQFGSPIFAGLRLNDKGVAEPLKPNEVSFPKQSERITPSLAGVKKVSDLEKLGVKDIGSSPVEHAFLANGKLNLVLEAPQKLNTKFTNQSMPQEVFDLVSHVGHTVKAGWTPIGFTWKDVGDFFKDSTQYNDPIQGAVGDCWLIAALAAVAWADPYHIEHRNRSTSPDNDIEHVNALQFYSKPGGRDAPTARVEVTDSVIVNSMSNQVLYCRSREGAEIWPDVYEKAFAKWTTRDSTDTPDITALSGGDPAKAMAQITNKTPYYYETSSRTPEALYTIVRINSINYKTINPMTAWTYASGSIYTGSNIVANHAYTVLGWAFRNGKEYIVLRNPWGVTEPTGLNTYQGLLSFFDFSFWRPISTIGNDGVFALEAPAFKVYFAYLAVAK
ncbi:hypothetical protein BGZ60DRAFT_421500 [Tricladium varicosporioides]|nr:hypothetical protein BGZ60DRAFT_421500 [Hymenoscyphus varicosporioides]